MSTPSLPFPQPLAEKYRPRTIGEFIGLERQKRIIANFARNPRSAAFLFTGPSGTGKTTMALALCDAIGGELIHIPSQHCTVAELEESLRMTQYVPMAGKRFWFVLVDEADQMTDKAQLALLSKLDSTGRIDGCVFVFTCNSTERLEARFLSRCLSIEFSSYGMAVEIAAYLEKVWHAEGGNGNGPDFARLVKDCRNNVRDCLGRLEVELLALRAGAMAALLILNIARVRMKKAKKTYSTRQAAAKMRVSFRTLNRWLADGKIKPSTAIKMPTGRTLWLWSDADMAKGRKVKAAQTPGPKPKGRKR